MPTYVELPIKRSPTKLADWLEVNALVDADGSASKQDLLCPLKRDQDLADDQVEQSEADLLASEVFCEINRRAESAGEAYPFSFDGEKIGRKGSPVKFLSYVYCLLISFFGVEKREYWQDWKVSETTKKFEELSATAVKSLLDNERLEAQVRVFGWPRRWKGNPKNPHFPKALKQLCQECVEMKPRDRPAAVNIKDAGLDVVAWKPFPDRLPGGLLFWGQCAAGADWRGKLADTIRFKAFLEDHTTPITGVFIPHVPDVSRADTLDELCIIIQQSGMFFNRCRIARLTEGWRDEWVGQLCSNGLKAIRTS